MANIQTYTVQGMTCQHCVASVTEEVKEVTGVNEVNIELDTGRLSINSDQMIDDVLIQNAVKEAGYQVIEN